MSSFWIEKDGVREIVVGWHASRRTFYAQVFVEKELVLYLGQQPCEIEDVGQLQKEIEAAGLPLIGTTTLGALMRSQGEKEPSYEQRSTL